jgi:hypothetical protein
MLVAFSPEGSVTSKASSASIKKEAFAVLLGAMLVLMTLHRREVLTICVRFFEGF